MRTGALAWVALALGAGCGGGPPEVSFVPATRATLTSSVRTNGKLEPAEYRRVRSTVEGTVTRLAVEEGSRVRRGELLAEVEPPGLAAELAAAEARLDRARARLAVLETGGSAAARVEIESALAKALQELEPAREEAQTLGRLAARQAATRQEAEAAARRVEALELEITSLEKKREVLAPEAERAAAAAEVREAASAVEAARGRIEASAIRAPLDGTVYRVAVRPGAFVRPGDEVAGLGTVERLRAVVYVDEPELGRVAAGQPVEITWDAEPHRTWRGEVERMPAEIVAVGNRQVGEVICRIENPDRRLPPGANINAEIRTRVVEGALTVPKEALRRREGADGVFVLSGERIEWRPVETGSSGLTDVEVSGGLREGDLVAVQSGAALEPGMVVRTR